MITELLDKSFVVESMQWVKESIGREAALLETNNPEAKARSDEAGTSQKDLESAEEQVEEAHAKEAGSLAGAPDKEEPFFPRNPGTALIQSSLHEFFEKRDLVQEPQDHGLEPGEIAVTMRSLRPGALAGPNQKLFEPFEQTDAGWVSCKIAEAFTKFRGRHKFVEAPARMPIANNTRIVLVADWATAIPRAQLIGTRMRDQLLKAKDRERHVIHLGDVYYSGWKGEYQNQFLSHWPVINETEGKSIGSWCLNGNHDMFSGGHDYFGFLLKEPRFRRHNGSSYFCLENDYWQIFGLDTAYDEYDLHGGQAKWIEQIRSEQPDPTKRKKVMLLSHHQPFTLYPHEGESPKVEAKLNGLLTSSGVRAWFWGHEHRCAIYKRRHYIGYPRLIGNGGVPVWASKSAAPMGVSFEYNESIQSGLEQFLKFGFAVLDFENENIGVRYLGENGKPYWEETFQ